MNCDEIILEQTNAKPDCAMRRAMELRQESESKYKERLSKCPWYSDPMPTRVDAKFKVWICQDGPYQGARFQQRENFIFEMCDESWQLAPLIACADLTRELMILQIRPNKPSEEIAEYFMRGTCDSNSINGQLIFSQMRPTIRTEDQWE